MARRERRHSFDDYSYSQHDDQNDHRSTRYENDKQRKVHFDDEYLTRSKHEQSRNRDDIREMNVLETTSKLKESYHSIDKGLDILRRIYENLMQSKQSLCYKDETSRNEHLVEINSLLEQVGHLQKSLQKTSNQKRHYLDELSRVQSALREDRLKIEAARESRHDLHAKMNASSKATREQQITINKLKRDNQNLWQILQEVKKHLIDEEKNLESEECSGAQNYTGGERESYYTNQSQKRRSGNLPAAPPSREKFKVECELYRLSDSQSEDGNSSRASSQDSLLSEKLKYLITRSENLQSMISKVGKSKKPVTKLNRSFSDNCLNQSTSLEEKRGCKRSSETRETKYAYSEDSRIPSENENGERCDAKDIIRRCEELERRVEQCSTKDMRERLMHQLKEIERNEACHEQNSQRNEPCREQNPQQDELVCCSAEHRCTHHAPRPTCASGHQSNEQWHPEIHKRVRGELFKCLDQMSSMEKNFADAQAEISRLRQYIKETSEQKEFHERTFKREAMQLRMVVDEKAKEVEGLKQNLNDAIKGLKDSEELIIRIDELEKVVESKDDELKHMATERQSLCVEMKEQMDEKSLEIETMKMEMKGALEVMERMRVTTTSKEKLSLSTEISMLQAAVIDVEEQMNFFKAGNVSMRQELDEKLRILSEVTAENEELIQRLHGCETEIQALRSNVTIGDTERAISSYFRQDERIRSLESELSKALSEKESILNSTRNSSYVRMDKTSEEHGQVIESLIDDNEKHLETIQQKDRIIEDLQQEMRQLHNTKLEPEDIDHHTEVKRYLEIIQKRNKTIEELREQLDSATTETDKKLVSDLINALSTKTNENSDGKPNIQDELKKIKNILSFSHKDLVDKIITLEEGLGDLKEENRALRKQKTKEQDATHKEDELDEKFHKVVEENATLRDSLNRPYPGLVQNILLQTDELKRLHEENELLRLGLSENKKELVESNLRKRQRIKDLQLKVAEYERREGDGKGLRKHVIHLGGDESTDSPATHTKTSDLVQEIKMLNAMVRELEKQNMDGTDKVRQQSREIKSLKEECERLSKVENANNALEFEVKNLRETLKDIGKDSTISKDRFAEDEGFTPTSPSREFPEKEDLHRMAKIADRERKRSEELSMKVGSVQDDKRKLKKQLESQEDKVMGIEDELRQTRQSLSRERAKNKDASKEISTLRDLLKDLDNSEERDAEMTSLKDDVSTLQEERVILQNKLEQVRQNNILLDRENNALKSKMSESNIDAIHEYEEDIEKTNQELIEVNRELDHYKQENKELQDINEVLVEEMEKIKGDKNTEVNETEFKNWLDQDVDRRLALLSPDTHRSDFGLDENDRQHKKDQQRLIRKLQIENQIIKAKLLSLEEENIAATNIISDMERGHGHLTGMLRTHLILQTNSTAKLLENSLQQYTTDYENLKKKFKSLEEKYSRQKHDNSNSRDDIWELFTNAGATITNINTILNEGLVKVEEDVEKDMVEDREFENRDYKSRLWILRRRLSDVENRHRELQLRAEELNLRLDAKQTEFEVTQDELEDATRDLESRENFMKKLRTELDHVNSEKGKLSRLVNLMKENQNQTISEVLAENEKLGQYFQPAKENKHIVESKLSGNPDLSELIGKLKERDAALSIMRRMREDTENENDELKRRVNYLEKKLKEMTEQRDKLKKEAEYRAGYMSFARDEYGTIHMLRDDLKKIAKENADLKHDVVLKQRQMYDMSKDLHKMRIKYDIESKPKNGNRLMTRKDEIMEKLIQDLANSKAERFILETKLKDSERRLSSRAGKTDGDKTDSGGEAQSMVQMFQQKLADKEREIEKLRRASPTRSPSPTKSPIPAKDDTMSDVISAFDSSKSEGRGQLDLKRKVEELKEDNKILQQALADQGLRSRADLIRKINTGEKKISQQRAEISSLNDDNEQKRKRIRELLTAVEQLKDGRSNQASNKKLTELVNKTKEDEMDSVMEKLRKSKGEVDEWKSKAENYQKEIEQRETKGTTSSKHESIMDQEPPPFFEDGDSMSTFSMVFPQAPATSSTKDAYPLYIDLNEPDNENLYEVPVDSDAMKTGGDGNSSRRNVSKIPVSPSKRSQNSASYDGGKTAAGTKTENNRKNRNGQQKVQQRSGNGSGWGGNDQQVPPPIVVTNPSQQQWHIPAHGSNQTESEVRKLSNLLEQTKHELDVYRTNLNMTEHETLDILGHERLNYAIDFQVSKKCMTELRTIKNDIYELEHENEVLQTNYVSLADSFNDFNDDVHEQLRERNKAIENQKSQIESHRSQNESDRLRRQVGTYEKEISELNKLLEEMKEHILQQNKAIGEHEEAGKDLERKGTLVESLQGGKQALETKNGELCALVEEMERTVGIKDDELNKLSKDNEEVRNQLRLREEECVKLGKKQQRSVKGNKNHEMKKMKQSVEDKTLECKKLTEELTLKSDECVKLQKKLQGTNIAEKNKELKRIKGELLEKTRELQDISEQLAEKIQEANTLRKQLATQDDTDQLSAKEDLVTIDALRQEIANSLLEITKRNEIIQELRAHIDKMKAQGDARKEQDIEDRLKTEQEYKQRIEELENMIRGDENRENMEQEYKDRIQELENVIQGDENRNNIEQEYTDRIEELENVIHEDEMEMKKTEEEYNDRIVELEKTIQDKDRESEDYLHETVKALEDAKQRLMNEISTRQRLEIELKTHKEQFQEKEDLMKKELVNYKNDLLEKQRAVTKIKDVEEKLAESREHVKLLEEELQESKQHTESDERVEQDLEECQQRVKNLEKNLEDSQSLIKSLEDKQKKTEDDLEREKESSSIQLQNLEEKLTKAEDDLVNERADSKKMKTILEKELGKLREMGNQFESYRQATEQEITHSTHEMHTLKTKLAWLEAEKKKVPPPKMAAIEEEVVEAVEEQELTAVPYIQDEASMFQQGSDLEVELEILQGCNEELEQQIESLQNEIKTLECSKEETSTELDRTREDLKKSLEYLADLNEKNNSLSIDNETVQNKLRIAKERTDRLVNEHQNQEYRLEDEQNKREAKLQNLIKKLESDKIKHEDTIEQLEEIIDQLENENLRKDTAFERLKKNNENNIKEMKNVMKELEDENKLRFEENNTINQSRSELQSLLREKETSIHSLQDQIQTLQSSDQTTKCSLETNIAQEEELYFEVERLQQELEGKIEKERVLEQSIDSWMRKSSAQANEIDRLHAEIEENKEECFDEEIDDAIFLSKQNKNLKQEVEKKTNKIHELKEELVEKDDQYRKVLTNLHKRRDESKTFLAMQEKLRNEIDSKEDHIRKLNFKLKSHDLDTSLNASRDDDLDQSDGSMSSQLTNQTIPSINISNATEDDFQESGVIVELSNQLYGLRNRNKTLSRELEACRTNFIRLKENKEKTEVINQELSNDLQACKDRVSELRSNIQGSPDILSEDDPSFVGLRTKLYASYQELREKSIEIASLRMCIEIKDDEIDTLKDEIEQIQSLNEDLNLKTSSRQVSETNELACSHSDDIKTLIQELANREQNEHDLQDQTTELRQRLVQKSKQNDYLQVELSKVKTRFRDIEQKLCEDDRDLREKFLHVFENDSSEMSEITPLNSVRLYSAPLEDDNAANVTADEEEIQALDETFTVDEDLEEGENYQQIKEQQLKSEEENLFYKEQVKSLQEQIDKINRLNTENKEKLETENDDLQTRLLRLQEENRQIETTKNDVLEKVRIEEASKRSLLETKLSLKEQRHTAELEHLKASLMNARNEHLSSVTKRMENNFQEKIVFQMKAKDLDVELKKKEKEIEKLKLRLQH